MGDITVGCNQKECIHLAYNLANYCEKLIHGTYFEKKTKVLNESFKISLPVEHTILFDVNSSYSIWIFPDITQQTFRKTQEEQGLNLLVNIFLELHKFTKVFVILEIGTRLKRGRSKCLVSSSARAQSLFRLSSYRMRQIDLQKEGIEPSISHIRSVLFP